jgi:hypothetical protein
VGPGGSGRPPPVANRLASGLLLSIALLAGVTAPIRTPPASTSWSSALAQPVVVYNCSFPLAPDLNQRLNATFGLGNDPEVAQAFQSVCSDPVFQSLVTKWSTENFTMGTASNATGLLLVDFYVSWTFWSNGALYGTRADWEWNRTTDEVTGPTYITAESPCSTGECGAPGSLPCLPNTSCTPDLPAGFQLSPPVLVLLVLGAVGSAVAVVYLLRRRRRVRPNVDPEEFL